MDRSCEVSTIHTSFFLHLFLTLLKNNGMKAFYLGVEALGIFKEKCIKDKGSKRVTMEIFLWVGFLMAMGF